MKILLKWFIKKPEREIVINVPSNLVDLGGYLKRAGISSDAYDTPDYANVISGEKQIPYFASNWNGTKLIIVDKYINNREFVKQFRSSFNNAELLRSKNTRPLTAAEAVQNAVNYVLENSKACLQLETHDANENELNTDSVKLLDSSESNQGKEINNNG